MKNKTLITLSVIAISTVALGFFYVGINNDTQSRILDSHKSKIEMQLAKYKHAQEVCGKENVTEETEYVEERYKPTGEYTCEDFRKAARTPEEKEASEKLEALDNQYSEYRYNGGVLNFRDWAKVTGN